MLAERLNVCCMFGDRVQQPSWTVCRYVPRLPACWMRLKNGSWLLSLVINNGGNNKNYKNTNKSKKYDFLMRNTTNGMQYGSNFWLSTLAAACVKTITYTIYVFVYVCTYVCKHKYNIWTFADCWVVKCLAEHLTDLPNVEQSDKQMGKQIDMRTGRQTNQQALACPTAPPPSSHLYEHILVSGLLHTVG